MEKFRLPRGFARFVAVDSLLIYTATARSRTDVFNLHYWPALRVFTLRVNRNTSSEICFGDNCVFTELCLFLHVNFLALMPTLSWKPRTGVVQFRLHRAAG